MTGFPCGPAAPFWRRGWPASGRHPDARGGTGGFLDRVFFTGQRKHDMDKWGVSQKKAQPHHFFGK